MSGHKLTPKQTDLLKAFPYTRHKGKLLPMSDHILDGYYFDMRQIRGLIEKGMITPRRAAGLYDLTAKGEAHLRSIDPEWVEETEKCIRHGR